MRKPRTPMQALLAQVPPFLGRLVDNEQGIAPVPFTGGRMVVVRKPEHVQTILSRKNAHLFGKGGWAEKRIAQALGTRGLFLTDDRVWWAQLRRVMNPAFLHSAMEPVAEYTVTALDKRMQTWQVNQPVDLFEEFKRVNIEVLMRHLFGAAINDAEIAELSRLADPVFEGMAWQVFMPKWLPGGWGYHRAIRRLETRVHQLIKQRKLDYQANRHKQATDLLWHLVASKDLEMSDKDLRDQVFTILMAGFDSTAAVLCWAARALDFDSHLVDVLRGELDWATRGEPLNFSHLPLLTQLTGLVDETLCDHPAFPAYFRVVIEECTLGGYKLAPGTQLIIGLHAMHHMQATDRDPNDALEPIPFGYGHRKCIGETMATTTIKIVLGRMLQRYGTWELADRHDHRTVYAMTERRFNNTMYLSA